MPETMRLIDPDGITRDVALDAVPRLLADSRWRVPTAQDEASRLSSQASQEAYGGVAGGIKAGAAALARGATLGLSDVAARALGGDDAAIALEGYRSENPGLSFAGELTGSVAPILISGGAAAARGIGAGISGLGTRAAGLGAEGIGARLAGAGAGIAELGAEGSALSRLGSSAIGSASRLTPAGLAESAGRSAATAAAGGLRGALAAGAVEGGLAGVGMGASQLALSRDPLTFERAAATIGSNVLFGAGIGGVLGVAANGVERGLHRAGAAIDDYAARRAAREAVAPDLVNMDRKGLKLAEEAELARIEAERVGQRAGVADEIAAFRDDLKQQKIWLTTKKGADEVVPPTVPDEVPAGPPVDTPVDAPSPAAEPVIPPREITSDKEFRQLQDDLRAKLTPDEIKQSLRYSREYYIPANRSLRGTHKIDAVDQKTVDEILPQLDAVIDKSPISEPLLTHRAAHFDPGETGYELKPGDLFVDPGYMSTSYVSENINRFGNVHFVITSPRGTKLAAIPSSGGEKELTLARNTGLRITKREQLADGRIRLHATVEVQGGSPVAQSPPGAGVPNYDDLAVQLKQADQVYAPEAVVPVAEIASRGYYEPSGGGHGDAALSANAAKAIRDGQREAIKLGITPSGKISVIDGRLRLAAAIEQGAPIKVKWTTSFEPDEDDVFRAAVTMPAEVPATPVPTVPKVGDPPLPPPTTSFTPPVPPQIEGLGPLGKRLLKTDRQLDRLLDNPKALADRPQRALDALQMQEAAYESILAKSDQLRVKFAADTSGDRIAALESIPAALERNRQLQRKIGELLQPPRTPRLDAIAEARDVLSQPAAPKGMVEQIFGGAAFGAVTSAVGSIPVLGQIPGVAAIIGAKGAELATRVVFGKMGQSIGAQAERASNIVKALTGAVKTAAPYAPVVATRTLAALRYGKDEGEQPKTLPALYKKRTDEIKQLTAYDETGTPRMRPAVREQLGRALRPIAAVDPILADRIETQKARGIEYLSSILPRRPDLPGVGDSWQPAELDMRSWARSAAAVEDPYGVLERAIHGAVTPEDSAVMRNVWPEMLAAFTGEVMSKLPELRATLPYNRQLALSILTGEAVTPAMDRKVMRVLQAQFPDEPGSAGGTQAPKAQPQFGSMRATTDQMTPSQSRVQGAV